MLSKVRIFLRSPAFDDDEEKTRVAAFLNILLLASIPITTIYALLQLIIYPNPEASLLFLSVIILVLIGLFFMMRHGHIWGTAIVLMAAMWLLAALGTYYFGGVRSPAFVSLILVVIGAGLLLGTRAQIVYLGLSILFGLALLYIEGNGLLPKAFNPITPASFFASVASSFIFTAVFINLTLRNLNRSLARTRSEIAERKLTEQALLISRKQFQRFVQYSPDMIVELEVEPSAYNVTFVNRRSYLGYTQEEWMSLSPFTDHVHVDDKTAVYQHWLQVTTPTDSDIAPIEYRLQRKNEAWEWLQSRATILERNAVGIPTRILITLSCITERKQLEEQLLHSQKMEAIGQLAGGIAHDFNNLLTVIITGADILKLRPPTPDQLSQHVTQIKDASIRAATLTQQLLVFSRQQILAPQILDVNTAVINMEKMLKRLIGEDINLITTLSNHLGPIKADPGQLEQIIMNLAVNARDAMPKGGQLTIETTDITLDEDYGRQHINVQPGEYVMLAVSDTGKGMDAATKAHIFEPFFTTKETGKGTGLGLATVHGIVKQNQGHIEIHSEPGQGAMFKIYFPVVPDREIISRSQSSSEAVLPSGVETILLVEDDRAVRHIAHKILETYGYTVLLADNGETAMQINNQHDGPIDLLLTDVIMPKMNGSELAKHITTIRPQTKVLYMSGYTDATIAHHGVLKPGTWLLSKPFTLSSLTNKVRELLDS